MTSVLVPVEAQPAGRLLTAADLSLFPTHLPSGDVDYELDRGRLVIRVPPEGEHGSIQAIIAAELVNQGQRNGNGRVFTEVGIVLSRDPDFVLGADLAFVGKAQLPVRFSREGYLVTIPDLAIEIRSKNDTIGELDRKVAKYLAAGVAIVLVVDPDAKTIADHRPGAEPRVSDESAALTLDELIPGFHLDLAECFVNGC